MSRNEVALDALIGHVVEAVERFKDDNATLHLSNGLTLYVDRPTAYRTGGTAVTSPNELPPHIQQFIEAVASGNTEVDALESWAARILQPR
jgi:hypothetical protein